MAGHMKWRGGCLFLSIDVIFFLIMFVCFFQCSRQASVSKLQIINIEDGHQYDNNGSNHFCYTNDRVPGWKESWITIQIRVWSSKELKVTIAEDEDKLQEMDRFSLWGLIQHVLREQSNETTININLFSKKTCFKIAPADHKALYRVKPIRKFDIYLFLVFLAGVLLFIFADPLSRSQVFYYSAGMSTGMIASLIILIFITARVLPKKSPFYVVIFCGWSFSVYIIQFVFRNLQIILKEHWHLALGYSAVVGFISFAVCYRHGPLVEQRSINILSWTLQLLGMLLIYAGIQVQQVALAIILAAFCANNLEYPVYLALATWRKVKPSFRWKPQPRRLLTEEEYQKQGELETHQALEELRKYCTSPEFNTWKTVSRLQSPKRFADFVEGSPHLQQNEVSVHMQEYGLGGSYFEDELFATDEDEDEEEMGKATKPECDFVWNRIDL